MDLHLTGYGCQSSLWVPRIAALGHEVAISGPFSFSGAPLGWRGFTVYPGGQDPFGSDVIAGHYKTHQADLMITLCDVFMMDPNPLKGLNVAHWCPVDCEPMGAGDAGKIRDTGAATIAMSRFGLRQMRNAGLDPYYIPHGIDTSQVFKPPAEREKVRASIGITPATFVVGINAANKEGPRKNFTGQMAAFAAFHRKHPDSRLAIHGMIEPRGGRNLRNIAASLGISDAVFFPDQYALICGMIDQESLAAWYGALDVLSNATWGEGFGLPAVEAQACGTPVVLADNSTGPELCGAGWLAECEREWVDGHEAWWFRPSIAQIAKGYERAWEATQDGSMAGLREKARKFALGYDVDLVFQRDWMPVLAALEERRIRPMVAAGRAKVTLPEPQEGVRDLLVVVPSRGHPEYVKRLTAAVAETATASTQVMFAFDSDDPALQECTDDADAGEAWCTVGARGAMAARVNEIAVEQAGKFRAVMFLTEDQVPRTNGWDTALLTALEATGGGFAYPCEPARPGVPSSMAVSSGVIETLGWMCEPGLDRSYMGNVWAELGKAAGCITYLPDVEVGQVPPETPEPPSWPPPSTGADEQAFGQWRAERMRADVVKLRKLRAKAG